MDQMPLENWRSHYLVFSLQSMLRAVNYINQQGIGTWLIECIEETDSKVGNGHTIVLRKFDQLPEMQWHDVKQCNNIVNQLIEKGEFSPALSMLKAALSYDFFDPAKLYIAAVLSIKQGDLHEGIEFLRQSLTIDPENENYRRQFLSITGRPYSNSVI